MRRRTKCLHFDKFWAGVAGLFLVGLALAAIEYWPGLGVEPFSGKAVMNIAAKLGEAMIIAAILAVIVDRAAKSKLLDEFAMDVSGHIIGRALPPELRKPIEDYLRSDFVRSNWRITYKITEWPDNPEYLQLVTRSEYEIQNTGDMPKDFTFRYLVEESFFPEIGKTEITRFTGKCLKEPRNECFDYPSQGSLKPRSEHYNLIIEKKISIPPYPHSEYTAIGESIQCVKPDSILPFFTYYLALATTLTIEYPPKLVVFLDLSFGNVVEDTERTPLQNGVQWRFKKPMLPGHTFTVRLRRKLPDVPVPLPPGGTRRTSFLTGIVHAFLRRPPHQSSRPNE